MSSKEVKIGEWFKEGFNLYQNNFVTLVITGIVVFALSFVSLGILLGPMMAGYFLVTLRLLRKDDPKPGVGDVFSGFDHFVQALIFVIGLVIVNFIGSAILEVLPLVGGILSTIFGLVLPALVMFAIPLIAERKLQAVDAAKKSFDTVKENLLPFVGFGILASVAAAAGIILLGFGVILTGPIYVCCVAVAYEHVFGREEAAAENVSTTMTH